MSKSKNFYYSKNQSVICQSVIARVVWGYPSCETCEDSKGIVASSRSRTLFYVCTNFLGSCSFFRKRNSIVDLKIINLKYLKNFFKSSKKNSKSTQSFYFLSIPMNPNPICAPKACVCAYCRVDDSDSCTQHKLVSSLSHTHVYVDLDRLNFCISYRTHTHTVYLEEPQLSHSVQLFWVHSEKKIFEALTILTK